MFNNVFMKTMPDMPQMKI